jgi:transposase
MVMNSPPKPLGFFDGYIDESSQTQHRYLVLGGTILPRENVRGIVSAIWAARKPDLPANEMKWNKVSRTKLAAYKRVVDVFFDPPFRNSTQFHCLIVDTTKHKHHIYNQGNRDIGFNKEIYQLALKFGRLYRGLFHIYPDRRSTTQKTDDLRLMLNRGIRKQGDKRDWPYRRLQFRDSKTTELLQLTDIFAGAIAYRHNGHDLAANASPAKTDLSKYILRRAGIADVMRDTAIGGKFTVWHRKLS